MTAKLERIPVELIRHCEPTGPRNARPDDRLREAIQFARRLAAADHGTPDRARLVRFGLRTLLAIAVSGNHPKEAIETARPVCAALKDGPFRRLLDQRRLCPP